MQKLILILAILTIACKKENKTEPNNGNNGGNTDSTTWKFLSMNITSTGSVETDVAGIKTKTLTSTSLTTTDNKGTVAFNGKAMTFKDVSYKYNGILKTETYVAGLKTTSVDLPISYTYPATTASFEYKKISADSLYFTSALVTGIASTGKPATAPAGAKLKWEGDKMTMTVIVEENKTESLLGTTTTTNNKATTVTTLQKQ